MPGALRDERPCRSCLHQTIRGKTDTTTFNGHAPVLCSRQMNERNLVEVELPSKDEHPCRQPPPFLSFLLPPCFFSPPLPPSSLSLSLHVMWSFRCDGHFVLMRCATWVPQSNRHASLSVSPPREQGGSDLHGPWAHAAAPAATTLLHSFGCWRGPSGTLVWASERKVKRLMIKARLVWMASSLSKLNRRKAVVRRPRLAA